MVHLKYIPEVGNKRLVRRIKTAPGNSALNLQYSNSPQPVWINQPCRIVQIRVTSLGELPFTVSISRSSEREVFKESGKSRGGDSQKAEGAPERWRHVMAAQEQRHGRKLKQANGKHVQMS